MRSRLKPDSRPITDFEGSEVESPEASGRRFEAAAGASEQRPRFVIEQECGKGVQSVREALEPENSSRGPDGVVFNEAKEGCAAGPKQIDRLRSSDLHADGADSVSSWQEEVSRRVSNYKARRRPQPPRYPSLQLSFDNRDMVPANPFIHRTPACIPTSDGGAVARQLRTTSSGSTIPEPVRLQVASRIENVARVIEFPRSSLAAPVRLEELAEPVFDRPRIMEAPEIAPAPPALGGILIDLPEEPAHERRPGFEIPLQSAGMGRRLAATTIDVLIASGALLVFGYIFWRLANALPAGRLAAGTVAAVAGIFWAGYQYLLVVHSGTTPGLKLAKLHVSRFDGTPVERKLRRWRVLASLLSGLSLGLGYAWCFLDEDRLCWHDRITRTYMAPNP